MVSENVFYCPAKSIELFFRLAFLPIYFTAYETGRHQVMKFLHTKSTQLTLSSIGAYNDSMHHDIHVCNRRIGLSIFS